MAHSELCQVTSFESPEDHALGLPQLHQLYLQTGPGRYAGCLQTISLDSNVFVYREQLNVPIHQTGWMAKGRRMFGIPLISGGNSTVYGRAVEHTIAHLAGGREFEAQSGGATEHVGIVLNDSTFERYADYLGGACTLPWTDQLLLEADASARRRAASGILDCLVAGRNNPDALAFPAARMAIRDDVLEYLFCLLIDVEPPRRRGDVTRLTYSEIVNRSREHLLANPTQSVGVLELCSLLRVSRRTLQTAFLEVAGVTPHVYLRSVRLSSVRRLLRQTSADRLAIKHAAARWGFVHMGRFSADYSRMFGHLPSDTLRA